MSTHHLDLVRRLVGAQTERKRRLEIALQAVINRQALHGSVKSGGTLRAIGRLAENELKSRAQFVLDVVRRVARLRPRPITAFTVPAKELAEALIVADYKQIWEAAIALAPVRQMQKEVPSAVQAIEWGLSTVRIEQIELLLAEIDVMSEEVRASLSSSSSQLERRKLTVIVAVDMVGYSALAEKDQERAIAEVISLRSLLERVAAPVGGRIFGSAGDGFMLEFSSCTSALEASAQITLLQREPKIRIGMHAGDVEVQESGDLLGHAVNVAERIRGEAEPGAALLSAEVRRMSRGLITERLVSRGMRHLAKMDETLELFELSAG